MKWAAFVILAAPVHAGTFQVPQGCTPEVTVQSRDCTVTHYYSCDADPAGYMHRVDLSEDGLMFYALTDSEARWLQSHDVIDNYVEQLGAERDPASLTELRDNGVDSFDFDMNAPRGAVNHIQGYDALTGETVVIDGVTLRRTEFQMTVRQGGEIAWTTKGNEYVYDRLNVFLGGQSTVTTDDDTYDRDGAPTRFDFEGDPGFMSTTPVYGCSVNLAMLLRGDG